MNERYSRRKFTQMAAVMGLMGIFGGCSGNQGDGNGIFDSTRTQTGPTPPANDANPRDLLPDPPEGWEQTQVSQQSAGLVGAEAGFGAGYDDPEGTHYGVEILRWSSRSGAKNDGADVYESGWPIYVVHGNFGFAGKGPDVDKTIELLARTPTLTVEYINQNNLNE